MKPVRNGFIVVDPGKAAVSRPDLAPRQPLGLSHERADGRADLDRSATQSVSTLTRSAWVKRGWSH